MSIDLPPEDGPAFDQMMRGIDDQLAAEGVKITARSWRAIAVVGQRYGISIPVVMGRSPGPPELERWRLLSDKIHGWYDQTYAERMAVNMSPGSAIVEIGGDLFEVCLPRIYGSFRALLSRKFLDLPKIGRNEPIGINLVQQVVGLTEPRAMRVSDAELQELGQRFFAGLIGYTVLESNGAQAMIAMVRGDAETAVAKLLDRGERWAESKWASLQATEKLIKVALTLEGTKFPRSHNLNEIAALLQCSAKADVLQKCPIVQCSPAARYGEEAVTRTDAVEALNAFFDIAGGLHRKGPLSFNPKWRAI